MKEEFNLLNMFYLKKEKKKRKGDYKVNSLYM